MPFIIKAASLALSKYPIINSWYDKDRPFEYTIVENHNINFAIDSPKGLVVPNIKNVQNLSILEINDEFNRIISAAQSSTLGFKDLSEGTFSISNIGRFLNDNIPQVFRKYWRHLLRACGFGSSSMHCCYW